MSHFAFCFITRAEAVGHYSHEEAVYCVALPYDGSHFFASAGECGAVFLWDVRVPEGMLFLLHCDLYLLVLCPVYHYIITTWPAVCK